MGCILAGSGEDLLQKADRYAAKLGLAFQVTDDILDITSTADVLGKPIASDAKREKDTYATLLGLEEAWEFNRRLVREAKEALRGTSIENEFWEQFADALVFRDR